MRSWRVSRLKSGHGWVKIGPFNLGWRYVGGPQWGWGLGALRFSLTSQGAFSPPTPCSIALNPCLRELFFFHDTHSLWHLKPLVPSWWNYLGKLRRCDLTRRSMLWRGREQVLRFLSWLCFWCGIWYINSQLFLQPWLLSWEKGNHDFLPWWIPFFSFILKILLEY